MKRRGFFGALVGAILAPLGLRARRPKPAKYVVGADPAAGTDTYVRVGIISDPDAPVGKQIRLFVNGKELGQG